MPTSDEKISLPREVEGLLESLRRRIRLYVSLQGAARAVIFLAVAFWLSLLLDWWLEPGPLVRGLILAAAAGVLVWQVGYWLWSRLSIPLTNEGLALLLERKFPGFRQSLITTVDVQSGKTRGLSMPLVQQTVAQAVEHSRQVNPRQVMRQAPLAGAAGLAIPLLLSIAGLAVVSPNALGVWGRRALAFSNELWPRLTHLSLDGFNDQKTRTVARGDDVEIRVRADAKRRIPRRVRLDFETESGSSDTVQLDKLGVPTDRLPYQEFVHTFEALTGSLEFDISGGDDTLKGMRLRVVDSPRLLSVQLKCEFPEYMKRAPAEVRLSSLTSLPFGTQLKLIAQANKPIQAGEVQITQGDVRESRSLTTGASDATQLSLDLGMLTADTTLDVTLHDLDGLDNREPIRLALTAIRDEVPKLRTQLVGIGTLVTPRAVLPFVGEIQDDFGLDAIWVELAVNDGPVQKLPPAVQVSKQPARWPVEEAVDLSPHGLKPGQKIKVGLAARDNDASQPEPHTAQGDSVPLSVVTPQELLLALQTEEIDSGKRLASVRDEMEQTQDNLSAIEFDAESLRPPVPTVNAAPADATSNPSAELPSAGSPSADAPQAAAPSSGPVETATPEATQTAATAASQAEERWRLERTLLLERALQNSRKVALDLTTLASAFDLLVAQVVNNRLENTALENRLRDEIAVPLRELGETDLPALSKQLEQLRTQLFAAEGGPLQSAALQATAAALAKMDAILAKIEKMEDFNELVAKLRRIIELQNALQQETDQERKRRLRSDLEE